MSFDDFSFQDEPSPAAHPEERRESFSTSPATAMDAPPPRSFAPPRAPSPTAARARAGLGLIMAGAGAGVGAVLAGPLGALAGLTGVGAARNLYRSQSLASSDPAEQGDAARSLALGVLGVAITGYLGYKIYSSYKDDDP